MTNLPKLRELCEFLGKEPDSVQLNSYNALQSDFFNTRFNSLSAALDQYDSPDSSDAAGKLCSDFGSSEFPEIDALLEKNKGYNSILGTTIKLGDSLLFDLARIASGTSRKAGYACYILGCLYDDAGCSKHKTCDVNTSYLCAAYFYGKALEKSYSTVASKKAYAEACAHLGWFDTAFYWYPEAAQGGVLARTYLAHRVRFCKEHGVTFPKAKNHIVCFEESKRAMELGGKLTALFRSHGSLRSKLNELERKVSPKVTELTGLLDREEERLLMRRKRSRRIWWLLFLLVTVCAAPGWLLGNGDGIQGISYKLFMAAYAPFGNDFTEGMSLAERLASSLDDSARGTIAGAGLAVHAILTLLWTTFQRFFIRKKHATMYGDAKRKLYDEYQLEEILSEVGEFKNLDKTTVTGDFKTLNLLTIAWHEALVENAPKFSIPSVYGEDVKRTAYTAGEALLLDYDAFVNALRMFPEMNGNHVLLWSGEELVSVYNRISKYEAPFVDYFTMMFESAALLERSRGRNSASLEKQISTLKSAVRNKEWESTHPVSAYEDSASYASSDTFSSKSDQSNSSDNFDRWSNSLTYGAYGTDEEIFDALHREGKISDFDAAKAKTYGWKVRDLDDDPYS